MASELEVKFDRFIETDNKYKIEQSAINQSIKLHIEDDTKHNIPPCDTAKLNNKLIWGLVVGVLLLLLKIVI